MIFFFPTYQAIACKYCINLLYNMMLRCLYTVWNNSHIKISSISLISDTCFGGFCCPWNWCGNVFFSQKSPIELGINYCHHSVLDVQSFLANINEVTFLFTILGYFCLWSHAKKCLFIDLLGFIYRRVENQQIFLQCFSHKYPPMSFK